MPERNAASRFFIYGGVACTTLSTLLLELSLTRIFSVILFYHFAFMAISIALFGLGAGAICSYWLTLSLCSSQWRLLGILSTLNAPWTLGALIVILNQRVKIQLSAENTLKLALIYFVAAIPFFVAGIVISIAIASTIQNVHRVYFFDLAGAGAGCILLIPLLNALGGPGTVIASAAFYSLAGFFWFQAGDFPRWGWLALALSLAAGMLATHNIQAHQIDVRFAKGEDVSGEILVRWNSFSRVSVKPDDGAGNPSIVIDADAATSIPSLSPTEAASAFRRALLLGGPALPYWIHPSAKTLVIGPGGGYDIARALASGSKDVTGVEINPLIANDIMRGAFAGRSQHLYFRPEVRIYVEDGRSYVRRSREKYQVIQMTLVDTWASTAAGAFALSENNLYTVEAFVDYFEHLTDDGLLAITRWEFQPPRESLRVVSLALAALGRLRARDPATHFLIGREGERDLTGYGSKDTVLIKRTPFTPDEIARGRQAIEDGRMDLVFAPGAKIDNPFTRLLESPDAGTFEKQYQYDITPVTDNRPFFFYTVRARDLWAFVTHARSEDVKLNMGVMMLFALLAVSLLATAMILAMPPLLLGAQIPRDKTAFLFLTYFFGIGVGFIMIEVCLVQKFVMFLGRPTYSLTVVIFSLLLSSGLGSYCSARLIADQDPRLRRAIVAIILLVAGLGGLLSPILRAGIGLPLATRCLLTMALLSPAGFLMGMPFPCGLKRLESRFPTAVQWAWAVNSASSVLGSVAAVFFAIHLGLAQTLLLGASAYIVALAALQFSGFPQRTPVAIPVLKE
jgi:hypothetical protein